MSWRSFVSIALLSLSVAASGCSNGSGSGVGGASSTTTSSTSGKTTSSTAGSTSSTGAVTSASTTGSAMGAPSVMFSVSPTTIPAGGSTKATVSVTNFTLVPPSTTNVPGEGHYHIYLDGASGGQYLYAGQTPTATFKILPATTPPGPHKLRISLSDNTHAPLSPPVEQTIDIMVQ